MILFPAEWPALLSWYWCFFPVVFSFCITAIACGCLLSPLCLTLYTVLSWRSHQRSAKFLGFMYFQIRDLEIKAYKEQTRKKKILLFWRDRTIIIWHIIQREKPFTWEEFVLTRRRLLKNVLILTRHAQIRRALKFVLVRFFWSAELYYMVIDLIITTEICPAFWLLCVVQSAFK